MPYEWACFQRIKGDPLYSTAQVSEQTCDGEVCELSPFFDPKRWKEVKRFRLSREAKVYSDRMNDLVRVAHTLGVSIEEAMEAGF